MKPGFFLSGILWSAATAACLSSALYADASRPRYVFYFIGDGMGLGHVSATQAYLREVHPDRNPLLMTTFPVVGMATTYSASSPITDSAASGTALSTGFKTVNSRVAMLPDSTEVRSIAHRMSEAGMKIGILSSVAGDDATPAVFYSHALGRYESGSIATRSVRSGLTFLGGGGFKILSSDSVAGKRWLDDMRNDGYTVARGICEYRAYGRNADKILMMSHAPTWDQIGYTIDSIPGALKLREMTEACLETLERTDTGAGFFMMVEGGNIDWVAHANDGGGVIKEILNFQDAIEVAYSFYKTHPDETLIVVTADHDTGGMSLGRTDNRYNPDLAVFDLQRMSKDVFADRTEARAAQDPPFEWDEMRHMLETYLGFWNGIDVDDGETELLQRMFHDTFVSHDAEIQESWYRDYSGFAALAYDILNRRAGIGWTTTHHTGNYVPVYAIGAGAELFGGLLDNALLPKLIEKAVFDENGNI